MFKIRNSSRLLDVIYSRRPIFIPTRTLIMSQTEEPAPGKRRLRNSVSPPPLKRRIQSTTTSSAVSSFFKPASQRDPEKTVWTSVATTVLVGRYDSQSRHPFPKDGLKIKIAAFDFDGTLVSTRSGKQFAKEEDDWKWWAPEVPTQMKNLHQEGYNIVVLSNQSGLSLETTNDTSKPQKPKSEIAKRLNVFKKKVSTILNQLDIPITIFAATEKDEFRKPCVGMWNEMEKEYDIRNPTSIDFENSVFVGDAGGRVADSKIKKDFSCSDRNFAANVGIKYFSPEEFFLHQKPREYSREFMPADYCKEIEGPMKQVPIVKPENTEIILLCGSPGAGKSTFFWSSLQPLGYERVNQDTLKTRDRCVQQAKEYIMSGKSVVVDNTNADRAVRAVWVDFAKRLGVSARCFYFTAPISLCKHNDTVRALNKGELNPEARSLLPRVAFASFGTRFQAPSVEEGFTSVQEIAFQFSGTDEMKKKWAMYWI